MAIRLRYLFLLLLGLPLAACVDPSSSPELHAQEQKIIGGELESGHPAVGSLTMEIPGHGYLGSTCSSTLIDEEWLLTAAHCLVMGGSPVEPSWIEFYNGENAEPVAGAKPAGNFYEIDAVYVHPGYNDVYLQNDIGLAHLAAPITDITPYPINRSPLDDLNLPANPELFYVGYGVDDDLNETGGGIKRSAWIDYHDHDDQFYYSYFVDSGVCFGDSGGPGLLPVAEDFIVVGVNSHVSGADPHPCQGRMGHTRVDQHLYWLDTLMAGQSPDCNVLPSSCRCEDACLSDGSCDDSVCPGISCDELFYCAQGCFTQECVNDCTAQATPEALQSYQAFWSCLTDICYSADDINKCITQECDDQFAACWDYERDLTCSESLECYPNCQDQECLNYCYFSAEPEEEKGKLDALLDCGAENCGSFYDPGYEACVLESCLDEYDACYGLEPCAMTGGDCEAGQACAFNDRENAKCWDSSSIAVGEPCDPGVDYPFECEDGAGCFFDSSARETASCYAWCYDESDCPEKYNCTTAFVSEDANLGYCTPCHDGDKDGYCYDEDCDDSDDDIHPDAIEICLDEVDNNCDGNIDEGCAYCADQDADGVCEEFDCDDHDASLSPIAEEVCGDEIDNNCNGEIDESCVFCLDEDEDGVCAEFDCDDQDATRSPSAEEICGDEIDNNCDGEIDESCALCIDEDEDGSCSTIDCDDQDPAITPTALEYCGDKVDNNCNGEVDENCETIDIGGESTSSSSCSMGSKSHPRSAPLSAMLLLLGAFFIFRRKR